MMNREFLLPSVGASSHNDISNGNDNMVFASNGGNGNDKGENHQNEDETDMNIVKCDDNELSSFTNVV